VGGRWEWEGEREERREGGRAYLEGILDGVLLLAPAPGRVKLTCRRMNEHISQ